MPAILRSNMPARGLTEQYRTAWDPEPFRGPVTVVDENTSVKAPRPRPTIAGVSGARCSVNSNIVRVMREHGFIREAVAENTTTFRHAARGVEVVAGTGGKWRLVRRGHVAVEGNGWRKLQEVIEEIV